MQREYTRLDAAVIRKFSDNLVIVNRVTSADGLEFPFYLFSNKIVVKSSCR